MFRAIVIAGLGGVLLVTGCQNTGIPTPEQRIREGYHQMNFNPNKAEKQAKRLIQRDAGSHSGLMLLARAQAAQGNAKAALETLDRLDKLCPRDFTCEDPKAHVDGALMRTSMCEGDARERALVDADKGTDSLVRMAQKNNYAAKVKAAEDRGDPLAAAEAFDGYLALCEPVLPSDAFHGVLLYVTTYQYDKAKTLWPKLTLEQKSQVRERFSDLTF